MKTKTIVTLLTAAMLNSGVAVLMAQDAPNPAGGELRQQGKPGKQRMQRPRMRAPLTPEEHEKLKAAREKAKSDPKVVAARDDMQAAGKGMRDTLHAALLKEDPSLGPILEKIEKAMEERRDKGENAGPPPEGAQPPPPGAAEGGQRRKGPPPGEFRRGPGPRLDMLTEEERAKFRAAHEKVKDDTDVQAARKKADEAAKNLRDAERAAMIAADPGIEPILKKLDDARAKRGGGPGRRMGPPEGGAPDGKPDAAPPGPPPAEDETD
jgi:hypothetical protein